MFDITMVYRNRDDTVKLTVNPNMHYKRLGI